MKLKRITKKIRAAKGSLDFLNKAFFLLLAFCALLTLPHCPKDLPQQELSEARMHLASAEEEGAATREAQLYGDAKASLLEAHQLVATEEFSEAQEKAQVSIDLAMEARGKSMPAYLDGLEKQAKAVIDSMEEKGAHDIDAQNFEAAQNFHAKGEQFHKDANETAEKALGSRSQGKQKTALHRRALAQYRSASLAYKQVKSIGLAFEKTARSQGLDIEGLIKLAKGELGRVTLYGASKTQLEKPSSQLGAAEKAYGLKKYAEAKKSVTSARQTLAALLKELEPLYAGKLLEEAKDSVAKAEEHQKKSDTPEERQDAKKSKILDFTQEQLSSAQEARDTAEKLIGEENYSESIKESQDALNLSRVILEQVALLTPGKRARAVITPDGNGLVEDIGEGWKRYTVRDRKPADCLWCISAQTQVYGSGALWERIYTVNRKKIRNPNVIHPGQVLLIPPAKGQIGQPPSPSKSESKSEESK